MAASKQKAKKPKKPKKEKPEDFLTPYLGPRFYRLRKGRMTQEELAAKIRIHPTTLGRIESGMGRITPDVAERICMVLGENVDEMIAAAIEELKADYKRRPPVKVVKDHPIEVEPLQALEEKLREIHDDRLRSERELRETIFEYIRGAVAALKPRGSEEK